MDIVHLATEFAPMAKVGGLADVISGLSKEMVKAGHRVGVVLPKYNTLDLSCLKDLKIVYRDLISYDGPYPQQNTVWSATYEGVQLWLLESHHPDRLFERGQIYGCPDDVSRFIYFTRTALEFLFKRGLPIDALHIHDWPVSIAAPLYKEMYIPLGLKIGGVVLTVHNLEHQGKCLPSHFSRCGLNGDQFLAQLQDPYEPHLLNLLKGGLVYSDFITTVSPTYAKEVLTPEGGCGLHLVLKKRQDVFTGVLNGIDTAYWNPATDPFIAARFSAKDLQKGKESNKQELRARFQMKESSGPPGPLVCCISRLVKQKGPHLIQYALSHTLEKGGQFIVLGSAPDPALDQEFRALQMKYKENANVAFYFDHDEALAHLVYAAADMIVIPSLFEPCGLTQMIGMRYGTVPLVRKTGGLADTVIDGKNGFTFDFPDTAGIAWALDRAFELYMNQPASWQKLTQQCLKEDWGWRHSAEAYIQIYGKFASLLRKAV